MLLLHVAYMMETLFFTPKTFTYEAIQQFITRERPPIINLSFLTTCETSQVDSSFCNLLIVVVAGREERNMRLDANNKPSPEQQQFEQFSNMLYALHIMLQAHKHCEKAAKTDGNENHNVRKR